MGQLGFDGNQILFCALIKQVTLFCRKSFRFSAKLKAFVIRQLEGECGNLAVFEVNFLTLLGG